MWFIPSGHQMLWFRPSLETTEGHEMGGYGDEGRPPDTNTWFSLAYDPNDSIWVARHNWQTCRDFMKGVTGGAVMGSADLYLTSAGFPGADQPALVLLNYQYLTENVPKQFGNAFREPSTGRTGGTFYRYRTPFVRQLDASIMTPVERLQEMTQLAIDDPEFATKTQNQFGMLANPLVLLSIAAVFGVFIGVGAGAAVVGGAAFANAVCTFMGLSLQVVALKTYVDLFKELQTCCFSGAQKDFVRGVAVVQQLLIVLLMDISLAVLTAGAARLAAKAGQVLRELVLRHAPIEWLQAGQRAMTKIQERVILAGAGRLGYASEQLMRIVDNPGVIFRRGEDQVLRARSANEQEMICIRGGTQDRLTWLDKLNGWLDGKPNWIKAKSKQGWNGLMTIPKSDANKDIIFRLVRGRVQNYPMGNLKGVFPEIDRFIESHPNCPCYELPHGMTAKTSDGKDVFDWTQAGQGEMRNGQLYYPLAEGFRVVDIGDRYLIVDRMGRPICQDLDIGSIQSLHHLGQPAGAHLPKGQSPNNPEDNFVAEDMLNWKIYQQTGEIYSPIKGGGSGGSARHKNEQVAMGGKYWTPRRADGTFDPEELYVYLPVRQKPMGWTSKLVKFDSWGDFEKFCKANGFDFPF